ncbi:MAG: PLP-dependent aspartate aminotransferase family protein [Chlorobi bacterium]|nr:PLP-dependent aspartate aminotransferase family protein [Chlorobiota bacterium]MCI0716157.1 PLP-dependent aspartate aminotransferase family protein [Chlorobiota bacterium]
MKFSTKAIHAGNEPDKAAGAVNVPIYATSTYANEAFGVSKGYDYGRTINPTRTALETNLASLENGKFGFAFSSGMAATQAVISLLKQGDHVIVSANVYGGTYRIFEKVMRGLGLDFSWVDTSNYDEIAKVLKPNTKMIFIETPTNPMLTLTDLDMISKFAKKSKLISVCDNTFMSPYFQNPLDFGIDIVVHSTTKYIGGHSDVIGGCAITNNTQISEQIKFIQNSIGAVPSPFDCYLLLRSTKTLALRMERHNENAVRIANELDKNWSHKIQKVYYPELVSHPQFELAKKQMRGFGGIISLEMGSFDNAVKFFNGLKIFARAESLGGVESLVCHPVSMTHGSVPKKEREKFGLTDGLIRLSVGIEDYEDLMDDIKNALNKI